MSFFNREVCLLRSHPAALRKVCCPSPSQGLWFRGAGDPQAILRKPCDQGAPWGWQRGDTGSSRCSRNPAWGASLVGCCDVCEQRTSDRQGPAMGKSTQLSRREAFILQVGFPSVVGAEELPPRVRTSDANAWVTCLEPS